MMSGVEPDRMAVRTRSGNPLETVTSILMLVPGLAAMNFCESARARSSPQFGAHHTTSPAWATVAATDDNTDNAKKPASFSDFIVSSLYSRFRCFGLKVGRDWFEVVVVPREESARRIRQIRALVQARSALSCSPPYRRALRARAR